MVQCLWSINVIYYINKIKDKTCINFSTDAGKLLDKIQAVFMIKNSQQIA